MRKKLFLIYFSVIFLFCIIILSNFPSYSNNTNEERRSIQKPESSASLEDTDNILITAIEREVNFSSYGLVDIGDKIEIQNVNDNPIDSFLFGIPKNHRDDLIYLEVLGKEGSSLLYQYDSIIVDQFELISVYFDEPILPLEKFNVYILQTYKDLLDYGIVQSAQQINYTGYIFPIMPYVAKGSIVSSFRIPDTSTFVEPESSENVYTYNFSSYSGGKKQLSPFLGNLGSKENVSLSFSETSTTKMELLDLNREIYINPWGIIKVTDDILVENVGEISVSDLAFTIPGDAKSIFVSDELGEIQGVTINPAYNYTFPEKEVTIDLTQNRAIIPINSRFRFTLEYNLPIGKYLTFNWIQESIRMNIYTTKFDFLCRSQTINIVLEGTHQFTYISHPPNALENTIDGDIITYNENLLGPKENKVIQFTYTLDFFDLFLPVMILILTLMAIASIFVVIIKTRKREEAAFIKEERLPISDIREFCLLYEERSALLIENRNLLEDLKYKRVSKPKFKNTIDRNESRIEELKKDTEPLKEVLSGINDTFANIVQRLELLDAERLSVNDSLRLLEVRYKKGKLPSKVAYQKLTDDFEKRRSKIDRSIDRIIQQLRSYLLK